MLGNSAQKKVESRTSKVEGRKCKSRFTLHVSRSFVPALLEWFANNARGLPWRRTRDPYAIWVSEIMLQQTQVQTVIPYYERWMGALPTVQLLANASSGRIHKLWEGLGYYTRVRNMQDAARLIVEKHAGKFPTNFGEVLALPGIGRYTAGAICSIAFNQPTPILDGNVIRVLTRVLGIRERAREKETSGRLWELAQELVSKASRTSRVQSRSANHESLTGSCSALNQSLMELGATVCTPRQPRCDVCPVAQVCVARQEGIAEQLPNLGERVTVTARRFVACVIERNSCVLVRQRPAGVVNAHLWEFPNIETPVTASARETRQVIERELGCRLESYEAFSTVKHTITRYRVTLDVFRATFNGQLPQASRGEWLPLGKLQGLAFTSAHRKVLRQISALRNADV